MDAVSATLRAQVQARLNEWRQAYGAPTRVHVALSGGRDSSVLLHVMAALREQVRVELLALHVNHRLQPPADEFVAQCVKLCSALGVPLRVETLDETPRAGDSVEAWARTARYARMTGALGAGDWLLTAHHEDDQAESMLLNALRGAGMHGLRGIAPARAVAAGRLLRPLLEVSVALIERYAQANALQWIDDPSNRDPAFDRNFLRLNVFPKLRERWPGVGRVLARDAHVLRAQARVFDQLLDAQLQPFLSADGRQVSTTAFAEKSHALRCALLYRFIARAGWPRPARALLIAIERNVLAARADRVPSMTWQNVVLSRYGSTLYLRRAVPTTPYEERWDMNSPLVLPSGVLRAVAAVGDGLSVPVGAQVYVCSRRGGERCRLPGRPHRHALKDLLQQWRIPPWQRAGLPLLCIDGELAAVADRLVCAGHLASGEQAGWRINWQPND